MPTLKESFYFDAPLSVVWDVSTDFDAMASMTGVTIERLTEGDFDQGTRWRETRTMMGRPTDMEWEVTRIDEPNSLRAVSDSMGASWVYDQYLVPDGSGTRMFVEIDVEPNGTRAGIGYLVGWPLFGALLRSGMAKDYGKLADLCAKRAGSG